MFKRIAAVLLLVTLVLTAIGVYIVWERGGGLRSDPAALRANPVYDHLLTPEVAKAPSGDPFANVKVEFSSTEITVITPARLEHPQPEPFRARLHRAGEAQRVQVGTGAISFEAVAIGIAAPKTNFDYSVRVPARFYSRDLRLLTTNEANALVAPWNSQVDFRGVFPTARFIFAQSNIVEMKQLGFQVFDARTHYDLSRGSFSSSSHENVFWHESEIGLWHQTPLEIFLTVGVGPIETVVAPFKVGEVVPFPGGVFKLLALVEGGISGSRQINDGKTKTTTLRIPAPSARNDESTVIFMTSPSTSGLPVDFEFLDSSEDVLRPLRSSFGELSSQVLQAPTNAIARVRLKYYTSVHRIIFRLPELPGLPEENRGVKNLFDVRIPYMRFEHEWTYQHSVGQLVQMSMPTLALNFTNAYFPLLYENTTPRALFRNLNSQIANPERELQINEAEHKVELKRSLARALLQKLRTLLPE